MYSSHMIYQVEHVKPAGQQREEDTRAGELGSEFGQLWHSLAPRRAGGRRGLRAGAQTSQVRADCGRSTGPQAVCG